MYMLPVHSVIQLAFWSPNVTFSKHQIEFGKSKISTSKPERVTREYSNLTAKVQWGEVSNVGRLFWQIASGAEGLHQASADDFQPSLLWRCVGQKLLH